ncbi:photosystem II complex extrinsic protein PsbU [Calothrix sp. NIES-3974]|uniref:photosystem II complex extrinsic protein PsbU n=1 Tax=Calothrix sp. NIES-3974 TaxID=2005462 RepID=UPI000B5F5B29|nr:photosystem II complex extrinsic protein PsbU [Calothrix sp. NIES-3974]BAZ03489.1 photosystem II complex extrinsic protein precursor PsuB [Calothrix sp. NIES-3974]
MKGLVRLLTVFSLLVASWGWFGTTYSAQAITIHSPLFAAEAAVPAEKLRNRADDKLDEVYGDKIDLNNTSLRSFQRFPGFYPKLASKIVQNAPYEKVEDVLKLEGLSEAQKRRLEQNLDNFIVTEPEAVFNEGDDRYNNGIYR